MNERKATTEKKVDEAAKESFPASDPPASHLPDEPPVNAQAKWDAAAKAEKAAGNDTEDPDSPPAKEIAAKKRLGADTLFRN